LKDFTGRGKLGVLDAREASKERLKQKDRDDEILVTLFLGSNDYWMLVRALSQMRGSQSGVKALKA
jgi:hypothetical protein